MKRIIPVTLALIFAAAGFTGCTKKMVKSDMSVAAENKPAAAEKSAPASSPSEKKPAEETVSGKSIPSGPQSGVSLSKASTHDNLLEDVYFDFDRYTIRGDSKKALEDDGAILKANSTMKITIDGHCDERGPSEYNLALGQKRADSAKRYLKDLGIDQSRIATISFGNEKPFCTEHNEACWQKNRTDHFVKN